MSWFHLNAPSRLLACNIKIKKQTNFFFSGHKKTHRGLHIISYYRTITTFKGAPNGTLHVFVLNTPLADLNKWATCKVLELPIQTHNGSLRRTYFSWKRMKARFWILHLQVRQGEWEERGVQGVKRGGARREAKIRRLNVSSLRSLRRRGCLESRGWRGGRRGGAWTGIHYDAL